MKKGGFAGRVLYVNLTSGEIKKEPLDLDLAQKFIGGLGMNLRLAFDRIKPGVSAFSPDNPIVLGTGPLVGTSLPATSRVYAVTKLPQSRAIGWCGGGGMTFGCLLKNAGYDHVVIEGCSKRPVFLKIIDDDVEISEASSLWGKGVEDTCTSLWDTFGRHAGVISIGQAGESMVSFSMAFIDRTSTLGRGGFGAVMGSKRLKAIMVKGSKGIQVADRKRYKALSDELLNNIREYPYLKEWQDLGLVKSIPFIPKELYSKIKKRRLACVSCPIGDKDIVEIPDGDLKGLISCSTSVVNLLTPIVYGFKDYREAIKCISILDDYGIDMFEFFGVLGFAKELFDQKIISQDILEEEIRLDSLHSMETWARKICFRDGLGDSLADGFEGIIRDFGKGAKRYAPYIIRGMLPYVGPRGPLVWNLFGTMELGQALDPRGPHVGASGSPTYFAKRPLGQFPRHLIRMGAPKEAISRILPGLDSPKGEQELKIGRLLNYSHNWFCTLGCLGICARAQINRFYSASLCAKLYSAVTGIDTTAEDLMKRSDRVWTLLRMANIREGFTRKDDALPEKWFEEPAFKDYLSGNRVIRQDLDQMIEDYYDERGWDVQTGMPTPRKLKELGLKES
ncbi:MAG: hypothetical protein J7L53_03550 [Deltaproteobacteria bacterium]|nr:hypothetical protein [Deltaproteobacteria bacterium]